MESSVIENVESLSLQKPFIESGECSDEVILKFDDSTELYVSKNFLSYASPVFKAMFQEGFKESEEKTVTLKGKVHEDMLELLLCIHPAVLKPVDRTNVLRIFPLTDEYHITVIKGKCEEIINEWLNEIKKSIQSNSSVSSSIQYKRAEDCLKILETAVNINHEDIINNAVDVLSYCKHKAFAGLHFTTSYEGVDDPLERRESCAHSFGNLPDEMKIKIQFARLKRCDT